MRRSSFKPAFHKNTTTCPGQAAASRGKRVRRLLRGGKVEEADALVTKSLPPTLPRRQKRGPDEQRHSW